jgi:hypothetical protein
MCAIPGVTYSKYGLSPKLAVFSVVYTDLGNDVITSVSLCACARMTLSTDRLDVVKENPMVADQPTRTSVVASANLCLACNPHLTKVKLQDTVTS